MRFMIMHKNDALTEAGQPPPMDLVAKMGAFIGEYAKTGRFIDGAGLGGSKTRTRLVFRNGRCTAKEGPYLGEHELPTATLLLKVRTREEAMGWAERYGKILGDCELELGKVNEPWDIGLMPAPEAGAFCHVHFGPSDAHVGPSHVEQSSERQSHQSARGHREFGTRLAQLKRFSAPARLRATAWNVLPSEER